MLITPPLIPATLIKRYKRFLGDVILPSGEPLTVHTPNTGAMTGCAEAGAQVWLRDTQSSRRQYRYSWEVSQSREGTLVGVHTGLVNRLVSEAIANHTIKELQGYAQLRQEVKYGDENSRIDLLLQHPGRTDCYVEIKNVTARDDTGTAFFPDAVSTRGTRHLRELMGMARRGYRAVIFFCVQRDDIQALRPADEVDAQYAATLRQALDSGVEALAYKARVSPGEIRLYEKVPVRV
ncbi:MAG: DNA/RNA nuclease SfsA [Gammaproteobacteria bacterium]